MIRQLKTRDQSVLPKSILGYDARRSGISAAATVQALKDHYIREVATQAVEVVAACVILSNVTQSTTVSAAARDNVTLADGDIVLCIGQTATAENGPFVYESTGTWVRAPITIYDGRTIRVRAGTLYADTAWKMTTNTTPFVLGTTAQAWNQVENIVGFAKGAVFGVGTRTPNALATRLAIDGDTDTGLPTIFATNSSSVTLMALDASTSSGGALTITANSGTAIEVSGGTGYHAYLHRNTGASAAPVAYIYNAHASDGYTTLAVESAGTGYAIDVTRSGTGTVAAARVRNTAAASHQIALSVSNDTDAGGYAIRGALTSATSSDPAVFGVSDGTGEGGWFSNTLTGHALRAGKSGTSGSALYVATSTSGNAADTIYATTVGTGRVANFERNNSTATVAVVTGYQAHASSSATAIEGITSGTGSGGRFEVANASSGVAALIGVTNGNGPAIESQGRLSTTGGLETTGSVPGIANGGTANPGGSATIDAASTDMAGFFTITASATPGTNGILATVTYANALPTAPKIILMTPRNAAAALEVQKVFVDMAAATTTTFDINVGATAIAAVGVSEWQYLVIQ